MMEQNLGVVHAYLVVLLDSLMEHSQRRGGARRDTCCSHGEGTPSAFLGPHRFDDQSGQKMHQLYQVMPLLTILLFVYC